jgi:signal transduction histidine kinase
MAEPEPAGNPDNAAPDRPASGGPGTGAGASAGGPDGGGGRAGAPPAAGPARDGAAAEAAPGVLSTASVVAPGGDGAASGGPFGPSASFLAHLDSLKEIQHTLALEGREEGILREGTTGIVEIVGADCAIAVIDPLNGSSGLRFGWLEGRHMATHEIEVIHRSLQEAVAHVREGRAARVVLPDGLLIGEGRPRERPAPRAAGSPPDPAALVEPPPGFRPRRFGSAMILDVAPGAGRRGVLILARHDPVPFGREDALLAEILAAQMAIQIDRARKANDARRMSERLAQEVEEATRGLRERNRELSALNAIAAVSGPSLEPDRQVDIALRKAMEITRHAVGVLHLIEEEDGAATLRMLRGIGDPACLDRLHGRVLRKGDGAPGRAWERGGPLVVPDLTADPGPFPALDPEERDALRRAGCRAMICVPVRARGVTLGTLLLATEENRRYSEAEVGLAQAIGDQVTTGLQNARLIADVMHYGLELEARLQRSEAEGQRHRAETDLVRAVIDAGSSASDLRLLLEDGLGRIVGLLGDEAEHPAAGPGAARGCVQAGMVHLIDPATRALQLRAQRGLSPEAVAEVTALPVGRTPVGRAFESGAAVAAEPCAGAPRDAEDRLDVTGLRILAAVPLRTAAGVHGVLSVCGRTPAAMDAEDMALLECLGQLLGIAVENHRAYQGVASPPKPERADRDLPQALVNAQKMESIGTLAGGIAHEFNNILGAILGYASHIRSLAATDNPIHRQAVVIEHQAVRAAELTKQLLAFARGGQYSLQKVDLNQVVAETASFLQKSVDPRIAVESRLDPDLPLVEADAGQMKQAVLNVAVNAVDAMPEGGRITFETRVAHLDERFVQACPGLAPGDYAETVIGDTGVGMPPEIADRAFEPFFTTKPGGKGTGLGLSVVYGIVRNHGGHVTLETTPGLGTTVRLYLPVASAARPRPPAPPSPEQELAGALDRIAPTSAAAPSPAASAGSAASGARPPEPPAPPPAPPGAAGEARPASAPADGPDAAGRAKIMVVDDEEAIREMMRDILESNGHQVVVARNGVEALDLYRQEWGRVALVLLDMVMPKMGGLEAFRRILGMDRSARVLLCSGYADNVQAQQAIREGALGFFPKPFTMAELLTRVRRVLGDGSGGS